MGECTAQNALPAMTSKGAAAPSPAALAAAAVWYFALGMLPPLELRRAVARALAALVELLRRYIHYSKGSNRVKVSMYVM